MNINNLEANCPYCEDKVVTSSGTKPTFCNRCGTQWLVGEMKVTSLPVGYPLPGGVVIEKLYHYENDRVSYNARSDKGALLRVLEVPSGTNSATALFLRSILTDCPILMPIKSYFTHEKHDYLVELQDTETKKNFQFSDAVTLVQGLKSLLKGLAFFHDRKLCAAPLLEEGIFLNSDGSVIIGDKNLMDFEGAPLSTSLLNLSILFNLPPCNYSVLDLLLVVAYIWPSFGVEDSFEETVRKCLNTDESKSRKLFYDALSLSPRIIEWPPLGEVLSTFLSNPGEWNATSLYQHLMGAPSSSELETQVVSHRGVKRANNEDSVLAHRYEVWIEGIPSRADLFIVADGMGGTGGGEIASRIAVNRIESEVHGCIMSGELFTVFDVLTEGVLKANEAILTASQSGKYPKSMGTTVVATVMIGNRYCIAWVGDSRAYKFSHDGFLTQLTEDHTMVAELVRSGAIQPENADSHPFSSKLTRALGNDPALVVDKVLGELMPGEGLLLTSDGFLPAIKDFIFPTNYPLKDGVEALTVRMLKRGGEDNASMVVFRLK